MMKAVVVLLLVVAAATPAFATDYTVGDAQTWTTGIDYTAWTKGKTFKIGDSLLFKYSSLHSVAEVNKEDYDSCSTGNPIRSSNDGNTKVSLTGAGSRYFICATPGHCTGGMKLAVSVAGSGGTPPSSPASPGVPPANTPPSPSGSQPTPSNPPPGGNGAAGRGGIQGAAVALGGLVALGLALLG